MFGIMWLVRLMRDYALKEKYNIKRINNQIKENRLLFEINETTKEEYKKKHNLLLEELEKAKDIMKNLSRNMEIQEGIR